MTQNRAEVADEKPGTGPALGRLLDELGIERAHIAWGPFSHQADDLIRERPEAIASATMVTAPLAVDSEVVQAHSKNLLLIVGEQMHRAAERNHQEIAAWDGVTVVQLPAGYPALLWSDVAQDNHKLITQAIFDHVADAGSVQPVSLPAGERMQGEFRVRIAGSGPPLVLFPIGITPTQWDALIPALSSRFTVIRIGGTRVGFAEYLEQRVRTGTYLQGVRSMYDMLDVQPGERVLDVGVGSGALVRDLATRVGRAEIVAVDINDYLLDEASALSRLQSPDASIDFRRGDAEDLPFENDSFDVAYSVTVFEECDFKRGIAELHRVLKPGGRAGVIIRAADLPRYWNVDVSEEANLRLIQPSPRSVDPAGCVDARLYSAFAHLFESSRPNPFWDNTQPTEAQIAEAITTLGPVEASEFEAAVAAARAAGTLFFSTPFHCVVGTKA